MYQSYVVSHGCREARAPACRALHLQRETAPRACGRSGPLAGQDHLLRTARGEPPAHARMTLPDGTDTRPLLTQHLDSVQYLRAVAVVMIVLYAIGRALQRPGHGAAWLQRGIDIFCVLSGFVLWNSTVSRRMSTLAFFRRRLARVVPLYWFLTTATVVGLLLLDPTAMETGRVVPMHVLRSYLFVPTIHPLTRLVQPLLVPGWTLNEAMYVYFLFGLCLLLPMAARLPAIWLMLLATVALRPWAAPPEPFHRVLWPHHHPGVRPWPAAGLGKRPRDGAWDALRRRHCLPWAALHWYDAAVPRATGAVVRPACAGSGRRPAWPGTGIAPCRVCRRLHVWATPLIRST